MGCEEREQDIWVGREEVLQQLPSNPVSLFGEVETSILNEHKEKVIPALEKMKKKEKAVVTRESNVNKKKQSNLN